MKIFLFSLIILYVLVGCADWDPLGPGEDVVLLNVQVHFNFEDQEVEIENGNWNSARVQISRRVSGYEYIEICDISIGGNKTKNISTSFDHGDKMKLRVRIRNDEGELLDRKTYFQLL